MNANAKDFFAKRVERIVERLEEGVYDAVFERAWIFLIPLALKSVLYASVAGGVIVVTTTFFAVIVRMRKTRREAAQAARILRMEIHTVEAQWKITLHPFGV